MKEGRMKGQAFITLPSEDKAKKALRDAHGYILQGKPMVIVSLDILFHCTNLGEMLGRCRCSVNVKRRKVVNPRQVD